MFGGAFDILAIALVKDLPSITGSVQEIRNLPIVEEVEVDLVTDTSFPVIKEFNDSFK